MADVDQIVSSLLDDYDNAVGTRQVSLAEAVEVTLQLIDALKERLQALQDDINADADGDTPSFTIERVHIFDDA